MTIIVLTALLASGQAQDPDGAEALRECRTRMSQLIRAMYNWSITKSEVEGQFPKAEGPKFWEPLVEDHEIEDAGMLRCPATGRRYGGPRSDANALHHSHALAVCEHGTGVVIMRKNGSTRITERGSEEHLKALETTLASLAWPAAGTRLKLAPRQPDGRPMEVLLKGPPAPSAALVCVVEISGGDLERPLRETLELSEAGVRILERSLGEERVRVTVDEAALERALGEIRSDDFAVRERATEALGRAYGGARERIEQALRSDEPELQVRLRAIRAAAAAGAPPKVLYPLGDGAAWENGFGEKFEVLGSEKVGGRDGRRIRVRAASGESEIVWSDELHVPLAVRRLKDGKEVAAWALESEPK
jgi:hypothetical protein